MAGLLSGVAYLRAGYSSGRGPTDFPWQKVVANYLVYGTLVGAFVGLWRRWLLNPFVAGVVGAIAGVAAYVGWDVATGVPIRDIEGILVLAGILVGGTVGVIISRRWATAKRT
jgi:hypothetical protein